MCARLNCCHGDDFGGISRNSDEYAAMEIGVHGFRRLLIDLSMKILLFAYLIASLFAGVDGWRNAGWFVGVAGIVAPVLGCWAGIGLRGSIIAGSRSQWIFGIVMAIIFLGIADWLMATSGYRVRLFGMSIGGGIWYMLGAFIGFLATSRKDTIPRAPPAPPVNSPLFGFRLLGHANVDLSSSIQPQPSACSQRLLFQNHFQLKSRGTSVSLCGRLRGIH